jgi:16S rRNA (guanine966-N2)-methyltransferase
MIKICSGKWKGHSLWTPPTGSTRPTSSKLRESLFNSIQAYCNGARVLDLFSGSGALGFEAMSRGAEFCVFVESQKVAQRVISQNIEKFLEKKLVSKKDVKLLPVPVEGASQRLVSFAPFQLVFADPPYGKNLERDLLEGYPWSKLLSPGALIILETGGITLKKKNPFLDFEWEKYKLKIVRQKEYGDKCLTTIEFQGEV